MFSSMAFWTCLGKSGIIIGLLGFVADGWNGLVGSTPSNHGIHCWNTARSCGLSSQFNIRSSNVVPTLSQNRRNVVSETYNEDIIDDYTFHQWSIVTAIMRQSHNYA